MSFEQRYKLIRFILTWILLLVTLAASICFLILDIQVQVAQLVFCALFGALIGKPLSKVTMNGKQNDDTTVSTGISGYFTDSTDGKLPKPPKQKTYRTESSQTYSSAEIATDGPKISTSETTDLLNNKPVWRSDRTT